MKVSIVTVAYNAAATILDTLQSVERQSYPDIEHLVIDGASKDGTPALVRREGRRVARLVSERDGGLYDAMNKGLQLAGGQIVAFLNADDWYADNEVVTRVVDRFAANTDLVYGDLDIVESQPPFRVLRAWRDAPHGRRAFLSGWHPAHPSTFMKTAVLRWLGGFDTHYRIAADYAMFARYFLAHEVRATHLPHVLTKMRAGGESTRSVDAICRSNLECLHALRTAGVPLPQATLGLKLARKALQWRRAR
jgi:glycosyltransferase